MSISLLTFALRSLILNSPNYMSRNRRLSRAPHGEEVLSAPSAIFHAPAGIVSSGRRVSIGRPATSRTREGWRFHVDRGALYGLPFLLTSNFARCFMSMNSNKNLVHVRVPDNFECNLAEVKCFASFLYSAVRDVETKRATLPDVLINSDFLIGLEFAMKHLVENIDWLSANVYIPKEK